MSDKQQPDGEGGKSPHTLVVVGFVTFCVGVTIFFLGNANGPIVALAQVLAIAGGAMIFGMGIGMTALNQTISELRQQLAELQGRHGRTLAVGMLQATQLADLRTFLMQVTRQVVPEEQTTELAAAAILLLMEEVQRLREQLDVQPDSEG